MPGPGSSVNGVHNYPVHTESNTGEINSMVGMGIQGTVTLGGFTGDNASFEGNMMMGQNVNNNSSFAATDQLNGTQPLSDWVIERLKKNQPRQVQRHVFSGSTTGQN